jgi:hypothetical protein
LSAGNLVNDTIQAYDKSLDLGYDGGCLGGRENDPNVIFTYTVITSLLGVDG